MTIALFLRFGGIVLGLRNIGGAFCASLCALFFSFPSFSNSIDALEAVLNKAVSLDAFLSTPTLVDEYYRNLNAYTGRVNREAFDAILNQLRTVAVMAPGIKKRLWDKKDLGQGFSIKTITKSWGRSIDPLEWKSEFAQLSSQWTDAAAPILSLKEENRKAYIEQHLQVLDSQLEELAATSGTGRSGRLARNVAAAKIFQSQEAKAIAAYYLLTAFSKERVKDSLNSGDADLVLDVMKSAREYPRSFLGQSGLEVGGLSSTVKNLLPSQNALLAKTNVFPVKTVTTNRGKAIPIGRSAPEEYVFRAAPRAFHGIWKGIPLGECIGGGGGGVDVLTPRRWATSAIKGTHLYFVESKGKGEGKNSYLGFVQLIPFRHWLTGKTYGSVDFGAPTLSREVIAEGDASVSKVHLYDLWLNEQAKRIPKAWKGLMVSTSDAIDNAGVKGTARNSLSYALGNPLGFNVMYHVPDLFARWLEVVSLKYTNLYGRKMVFDGQAGFLPFRLIELDTTYSIPSPSQVEKAVKEEPLGRAATIFRTHQSQYPQLVEGLTSHSRHALLNAVSEVRELRRDILKTRLVPWEYTLIPAVVSGWASIGMFASVVPAVLGLHRLAELSFEVGKYGAGIGAASIGGIVATNVVLHQYLFFRNNAKMAKLEVADGKGCVAALASLVKRQFLGAP